MSVDDISVEIVIIFLSEVLNNINVYISRPILGEAATFTSQQLEVGNEQALIYVDHNAIELSVHGDAVVHCMSDFLEKGFLEYSRYSEVSGSSRITVTSCSLHCCWSSKVGVIGSVGYHPMSRVRQHDQGLRGIDVRLAGMDSEDDHNSE